MEMTNAEKLSLLHNSVNPSAWPGTYLEAVEGRHPQLYDDILEWLVWLLIDRNKSASTCVSYVHGFKAFHDWVDSNELDIYGLTQRQYTMFLRWMAVEKGWAQNTRANRIASIKSFFDWREKSTGLISVARGLLVPKPDYRQKKRVTDEQLKKILGGIDLTTPLGVRDRLLVMMLWTTGPRVDELARLRTDDIELTKTGGKVDFLGKGNKRRSVPFPQETATAFNRWLLAREELAEPGEPGLFVSASGLSNPGRRIGPPAVRSCLRRLCRDAGISNITPHQFRVTFATTLYDLGHDIKRVSQLLGHNDIKTTMRYIEVSARGQSVRVSQAHVDQVIGKPARLPLWVQKKVEEGANATA